MVARYMLLDRVKQSNVTSDGKIVRRRIPG
ncbi:hypothetical protein CCACVL1_12247 [Corchorus capsularis]|uniref:Uncharacterized protein n=1 Tax=Corchorus capsularis TaxID=210143 RepID=A0A1R3IGP2_COCAP|nr:hypothetical protein CCACVL1_12247 [Corchorus capsularis]